MRITEQRKKRIIDLYYNQGKTTREIAEIERISLHDISAIRKEEEARQQKNKDQEQSSKAYKLFSEGKQPVEVAIALNLRAISNNTQEKDNNSPKAIDNLSLKLKQKKQEVQQLEINPNDILEEEEKR